MSRWFSPNFEPAEHGSNKQIRDFIGFESQLWEPKEITKSSYIIINFNGKANDSLAPNFKVLDDFLWEYSHHLPRDRESLNQWKSLRLRALERTPWLIEFIAFRAARAAKKPQRFRVVIQDDQQRKWWINWQLIWTIRNEGLSQAGPTGPTKYTLAFNDSVEFYLVTQHTCKLIKMEVQ